MTKNQKDMLATVNDQANVLLVEDEVAHRELISRRFESYGKKMKLSFAGSLVEAKNKLSKSIPDLAIVDYNMPDGKGLELVQEQKRKKYPIVMMTSHGDEALAVKAMKSGAFDYVVKSQESLANLPRIAERTLREWKLITQRKRTEQKLKRQYQQLKKINTELDRFVYSASHDLRAPLLSVLGLINISKIETLDKSQLNYLNMMEECIKRLDKYIGDITDYSRNNRLEMDILQVDFDQLINEVIETHLFMKGFSDIRLKMDIQEGSTLFSDPGRLRVILNNLLSNAIKYHNLSQADPFIMMSIKSSSKHCIFEVKDNGRGIGREHLEKVFDMFYRASDRADGSGLGLYITKETVSKLGGTIKVKSSKLQGTTFTVTIPNKREGSGKSQQSNNQGPTRLKMRKKTRVH